MSKERSEQTLRLMCEAYYNYLNADTYKKAAPYYQSFEDYKDIILNHIEKQSEQVQELESEVLVYKLENRTLGKECEELRKREQELEKLVVAYQTELSIKYNANKRIKKQNKRYREALEDIRDISTTSPHYIACKALAE